MLLFTLPRGLDKKMLVVMRTGDNAPTEEQVEVTNPELKRLISTETYLEEESAMDKQVREQNINRANKIKYFWDVFLCHEQIARAENSR